MGDTNLLLEIRMQFGSGVPQVPFTQIRVSWSRPSGVLYLWGQENDSSVPSTASEQLVVRPFLSLHSYSVSLGNFMPEHNSKKKKKIRVIQYIVKYVYTYPENILKYTTYHGYFVVDLICLRSLC